MAELEAVPPHEIEAQMTLAGLRHGAQAKTDQPYEDWILDQVQPDGWWEL